MTISIVALDALLASFSEAEVDTYIGIAKQGKRVPLSKEATDLMDNIVAQSGNPNFQVGGSSSSSAKAPAPVAPKSSSTATTTVMKRAYTKL